MCSTCPLGKCSVRYCTTKRLLPCSCWLKGRFASSWATAPLPFACFHLWLVVSLCSLLLLLFTGMYPQMQCHGLYCFSPVRTLCSGMLVRQNLTALMFFVLLWFCLDLASAKLDLSCRNC